MDRELNLRLKEIRGRISQADPLLVQLVRFAKGAASLQYGLVLVLDGVTVMGIPAPSATTGDVLDKQSVKFLRSMQAIAMSTAGDAGSWPEIISWYLEASPYSTQAKSDDEAWTKVHEKIGDDEVNDVTELLDRPDNLAEEVVDALTPPKAFTLIDARVRSTNGNAWEPVPNMRVNLSSVQAWWTFDLGVPEEAQGILAKLEKDVENSA